MTNDWATAEGQEEGRIVDPVDVLDDLLSGTRARGDVSNPSSIRIMLVPATEVGTVVDLAIEEFQRDRLQGRAPGWYRAQDDPTVARALRLLHDDPAHAWTTAALAAVTGVSRTTLSKNFTSFVGEPPMTYLTDWRITLAADQFSDTTPGATRDPLTGDRSQPYIASTVDCPWPIPRRKRVDSPVGWVVVREFLRKPCAD